MRSRCRSRPNLTTPKALLVLPFCARHIRSLPHRAYRGLDCQQSSELATAQPRLTGLLTVMHSLRWATTRSTHVAASSRPCAITLRAPWNVRKSSGYTSTDDFLKDIIPTGDKDASKKEHSQEPKITKELAGAGASRLANKLPAAGRSTPRTPQSPDGRQHQGTPPPQRGPSTSGIVASADDLAKFHLQGQNLADHTQEQAAAIGLDSVPGPPEKPIFTKYIVKTSEESSPGHNRKVTAPRPHRTEPKARSLIRKFPVKAATKVNNHLQSASAGFNDRSTRANALGEHLMEPCIVLLRHLPRGVSPMNIIAAIADVQSRFDQHMIPSRAGRVKQVQILYNSTTDHLPSGLAQVTFMHSEGAAHLFKQARDKNLFVAGSVGLAVTPKAVLRRTELVMPTLKTSPVTQVVDDHMADTFDKLVSQCSSTPSTEADMK